MVIMCIDGVKTLLDVEFQEPTRCSPSEPDIKVYLHLGLQSFHKYSQ